MDIFTENNSYFIHETSADFVLRSVSKEVHVVQYDNLLPIIKVNLFNNGEVYTLPQGSDVRIRLCKVDHTFVYKSVLGCNEERTAVYFDVDHQMTAIHSKIIIVLELHIETTTGLAGSSPIIFIIDKNPIQEGDIESTDEFSLLYELEAQVEQNTYDIAHIQEGGEPNVIESISIDNNPLPVDSNKNVNIDPMDEATALSLLIYGDD